LGRRRSSSLLLCVPDDSHTFINVDNSVSVTLNESFLLLLLQVFKSTFILDLSDARVVLLEVFNGLLEFLQGSTLIVNLLEQLTTVKELFGRTPVIYITSPLILRDPALGSSPLLDGGLSSLGSGAGAAAATCSCLISSAI
jgi:hypothetical protein